MVFPQPWLLTLNKKVSLESLYGIYLFLPVEDMVTKHIITFPKLDSDLFIEPASCGGKKRISLKFMLHLLKKIVKHVHQYKYLECKIARLSYQSVLT